MSRMHVWLEKVESPLNSLSNGDATDATSSNRKRDAKYHAKEWPNAPPKPPTQRSWGLTGVLARSTLQQGPNMHAIRD